MSPSKKQSANGNREEKHDGAASAMSSTLRCLRVLDLFAEEPYEFTLAEIATRLGVPKSSAHRLLVTLVEAGYVHQNASRSYRIASKALWVGTAYLRHSPIYRIGFGMLENLAKRSETMSHMAVWDNDSVLYLHTMGPPRSLNLFADCGQRRPIHATALGKAMLAYKSGEDLERIFLRGCQRFTEKTITDIDAMRKELNSIRSTGYSLDDEEGIRGLRCLAAPIWDSRNEVIAAISISATRAFFNDRDLPRFVRMVQETALRFSVQMGFHPPSSNLSLLMTPDQAPNGAGDDR
jgi:DNA-binding IclR family transcriptional regulator